MLFKAGSHLITYKLVSFKVGWHENSSSYWEVPQVRQHSYNAVVMHFHKQSFMGKFLTTCSCLLLDTYPEFWMRISPPLTQAPWSLFLKEINLSIRAATRGFSGSASWWGRNLGHIKTQTLSIRILFVLHVSYMLGWERLKDKCSWSNLMGKIHSASCLELQKPKPGASLAPISWKLFSGYDEAGT